MKNKISTQVLNNRITLFKDTVEYYQKFFNLLNWEISVFEQDIEDACASAHFGSWEEGDFNSDRVASICWSSDWINDTTLSDIEIKQSAFHEVMEVLLANLRIYSENTKYSIPIHIIDEEVHNIIRTFENTLFPLLEVKE